LAKIQEKIVSLGWTFSCSQPTTRKKPRVNPIAQHVVLSKPGYGVQIMDNRQKRHATAPE
jgi:hypothetical protein